MVRPFIYIFISPFFEGFWNYNLGPKYNPDRIHRFTFRNIWIIFSSFIDTMIRSRDLLWKFIEVWLTLLLIWFGMSYNYTLLGHFSARAQQRPLLSPTRPTRDYFYEFGGDRLRSISWLVGGCTLVWFGKFLSRGGFQAGGRPPPFVVKEESSRGGPGWPTPLGSY